MLNRKWKRLILSLAAISTVILLFLTGGCAALAPQYDGEDTVEWAAEPAADAPMSEPEPMPPAERGIAQGSPGFQTDDKNMVAEEMPAQESLPSPSPPGVDSLDRKIIKSAYMALDTIEFERTTDSIVGKAVAMGGYIESSSVQGTRLVDKGLPSRRSASFHIRIPKEQFEAFMSAVGELGVVTTEQLTGQDITSQYFDTETRVRTLKVQEERLLALLARAEKLADILEIERELSRIRFEIENLTGTLKGWDHLVEFSRISVDVYEVEELQVIEPKPETWFDRISKAFSDSLKNLVMLVENLTVFLVAALPHLLILAAIGYGVWKALRKKALTGKIKGGNENE